MTRAKESFRMRHSSRIWLPWPFVGQLVATLALLFGLGLPGAWAYERIITLEETQHEEVDSVWDRFGGSVGFGYGLSLDIEYDLPQYTYGPTLQEYLDRLGLEFESDPWFLRLSARFRLTSQLTIWTTIPYAVTFADNAKGPADDAVRLNSGLGDISAGLYYGAVRESKSYPGITFYCSTDSDTAKYYSFGDGLWAYTGGLVMRKSLSSSFYAVGSGSYTVSQAKNGVSHSDSCVYGIGLGIGSPIDKLGWQEIKLFSSSPGEVRMDDDILLEYGETLSLSISTSSVQNRDDKGELFSRPRVTTLSITLRDLGEDVGDDNTISVECSLSF